MFTQAIAAGPPLCGCNFPPRWMRPAIAGEVCHLPSAPTTPQSPIFPFSPLLLAPGEAAIFRNDQLARIWEQRRDAPPSPPRGGKPIFPKNLRLTIHPERPRPGTTRTPPPASFEAPTTCEPSPRNRQRFHPGAMGAVKMLVSRTQSCRPNFTATSTRPVHRSNCTT